jgi:hypothetical protein
VIYRGLSYNLTYDIQQIVEFPVIPMFYTSRGAILELVLFCEVFMGWVHCVSYYFQRHLEIDHKQISLTDLVNIKKQRGVYGDRVLREWYFNR